MSLPKRRARSGRDGFTLIEVVLAMTLMALITLILSGTFHLGYRAEERIEERFRENQRIRSIEELLGGYVRSAYPYSANGNTGPFFLGAQDRLAFVSAHSTMIGERGMSRVTLGWLEAPDGTHSVVLEEALPVYGGEEEEARGFETRVVLAQDVRGLRIDYLDSTDPAGEIWVEAWDGQERRTLPRAVRIVLQTEGAPYRTEWVFPVMIQVLKVG